MCQSWDANSGCYAIGMKCEVRGHRIPLAAGKYVILHQDSPGTYLGRDECLLSDTQAAMYPPTLAIQTALIIKNSYVKEITEKQTQ